MTAPFDNAAFPSTPDAPSNTPEGYVKPTQLDPGRREPPISAEAAASQRGRLIDLILREVVSSIFGFFSPGLGTAWEQLYDWFNNTLETLIINPLSLLVDLLVDILDTIPFIGEPLGNVVEDLANMFGLLKDRDNNQQGSADTANSGVARLDAALAALTSSGEVVNDNFDRSGSDLGTAWVQFYGSGVGSLGTDGNNARWDASGGAARRCWARHTTTLLGDSQMTSIVQTVPVNSTNIDPELHMILRGDVNLDNFVVAKIRHNEVEIGYYISGSYTMLGTTESVTTASGDRWYFYAGTTPELDPAGIGDERQFLLMRNDAVVCDRTDTGDVSLMGASYRHVGFGMLAGVTQAGFVFVQSAPPKVQGWAAADT